MNDALRQYESYQQVCHVTAKTKSYIILTLKITSMTIKNILFRINKLTNKFISGKIKGLLLFVVLIISINFDTQAGVVVTDSVQIAGTYRIYKLFLPSGYPNIVSYPAIINLHARCSNMDEHITYTNMNAVADTAKFIVAYPLGIEDPNDPFNCLDWNDNGRHTWDDVAFVSALISRLVNNNQVDSNRVFACGFSRGGFMCYTLACELEQKIKGIAVVSGGFSINPLINSLSYSCQSVGSKPVLIIHGTMDQDVNYSGYPNQFASVDSALAFWENKNSCLPGSVFSQLPDYNTSDGCYVTHIKYNNCRLMHLKIIDGGHSWPGSQGNILIEIPPKNLDINASAEIWKFFKEQFNATTGTAVQLSSTDISIFPNPANTEINIVFPSSDNTGIVISNVMGQVIIKDQNENKIDISNLTNGLYFISVKQEKKSYTQKLFKQ
ncbi:MAG: T9SS type A sorting domain-containing protein [Candidatus Kapaibacterium sp.]